MALTPILNSGWYTIRNVANGNIRDDEGALGAQGNSQSPELTWNISRNQDSSYILTAFQTGAPANPGGVISEIEQRFYVSTDNSAQATSWNLQPILTGSNPPIAFVIYQPADAQCPNRGHWELRSNDKKEPVKLNRDPNDGENQDVPNLYEPVALWLIEPTQDPTSTGTSYGTSTYTSSYK